MHLSSAHPVLEPRSSGFPSDSFSPTNSERVNHVKSNNASALFKRHARTTADSLPASAGLHDHIPLSFPVVLPAASSSEFYYSSPSLANRIQSADMTEEAPVIVHAAGASSPNAGSAATEQPFCSRSCLLILGPLSAGLIAVALIVGLVLVRRRRQTAAEVSADSRFGFRRPSTASQKGKEKMADDDDLMMEMFEPPELSISPNPRIMEWRGSSGYDSGGQAAAGGMGRSAMLGLSTIMEENMQEKTRDKMYGHLRRKSSHKLTPIRLNSPNRGMMRSDRSPYNTPPLSPSVSSSAQGSPRLVPFPSGGDGLMTGPSGSQFLRPAPKKKRKLTIPYNPQDVTRRRSLEGAW